MTGDLFEALPEKVTSLRVLLVDDDEFALEYLEYQLRALGFGHIDRARDGAAALAALDDPAAAPQLLICDLTMPGMDGIVFFRHLAARRFDGSVILASGADSRTLKSVEHLLEVHGLRLLGALGKPVAEGALLAALRQAAGTTPTHEQAISKPRGTLSPEELRAGLQAGCVEIHFQPKVRIASQSLVGVECLARWRTLERELLQPEHFIASLEDSNLIDELTFAVFRKATAQLGAWVRMGHGLTVSVNLSMNNLTRLDLPERLADIVRQEGIDPGQITLEITESRLLADMAAGMEVLARLRLMGFGLSIDDFGTGYSSIEKLKLLPFTELKVDKIFIRGATRDAASRAILDSSVRMGHALGMRIVAEGVESMEDWAMVAASGCDEVQGYYLAKALPADAFLAWKTHWEKQIPLKRPTMKTLLIIDDSATSRMLFKAYMPKGHSYVVHEAKDLDSALQVVSTSRPDLVVVDFNMPGHNGLSVAHALKETGLEAKWVLLTANAQAAVVEAALAAGFLCVIEKPITGERLAELLEEAAR